MAHSYSFTFLFFLFPIGEEEEETVFEERAKLFRFVESGEWKERGLGPVKILKNKATGKYRLVMRREQIHKVCLNHGITAEGLGLRQMESNDKAWLWATKDFAESVEGAYEKFCIRFKTKDVGLEFKQAVDDAVAQLTATAGEEEPEEEDLKEEEEDKPESEKDVSVPPKEEKKETPTAAPIFGSAAASKPLSFADLLNSNSGSSSGFKSDPNFTFPGAGTSVFKSSAAASPVPTSTADKTETKDDDDTGANEAEEYEPEVDFKPVVPLPDLVDVKTGEEDEEVLYKHRAKLFRYSAETKEFKERGLGDIKILKHRVTGKVRVILRREQILKLACNFNLTPSIELKPMSTSDKAFQWICMDFSEGELTQEGLAVKFKTEDIAAGFKQAWKDAVAGLQGAEKPKKDDGFKACEGAAKGFGSMFKPKPGSWECPGCMTRNGADIAKCPCCNTSNPNNKPAAPAAPVSAATTSVGFGDAFKPKAGSWECSGCMTRNGADVALCPCCQTPNPNGPPPSSKDGASTTPASSSLSSKLSAGVVSGGFSFGTSAASTTSASGGGGFSFGTKVPLGSTSSTTSTPTFGTTVPLGSTPGSAASSSGFTFGASSTPKSTSTTPVFGTGAIKFGAPETPKPASSSIFGTPTASTSIFGAPAAGSPATPSRPPVFGTPTVTATPPNKEVPSIFGGTGKTPPSSFVIGGAASAADKPAINFGGFTFGSTPVVKAPAEKDQDKEEKQKEEEKTAVAPPTGLFSGFKGFGNAAASTTAAPVSFASILNADKEEPKKEEEEASTAPMSSWAPPTGVFSFAPNKSLFSVGRTNSQSSLADSESEAGDEGKF